MIREECLVLRHEPQVDLRTGTIVGCEVVPRMQGKGLLETRLKSSAVARRGGFEVPLGEWTLRHACLQVARWHKEGAATLRATVKVAVQDLHHECYADAVRGALRESGLDPVFLELEVQEGAAVNHFDGIVATLRRLKSLGVQLALGSFGTGRCSLSLLRQICCDRLKIHPTFLQVTADHSRLPVARAIISLARGLGLAVLAEGVETKRATEILAGYGCHDGQGPYFGSSIPSPVFAAGLWVAATKEGRWSVPAAWAPDIDEREIFRP
jgi:EAL domain-containing protein (putative c-di-GMP-specific phosphodiesterase class I)